MLSALNKAILRFETASDATSKPILAQSKSLAFLQSSMRMLTNTICQISSKLCKQGVVDNKVSKLEILSGGFEQKFIPALSQETKLQIEGSFKMTGDKL